MEPVPGKGIGSELVKKRFLTSSQTRPVSLGSRLKGLRLAAAHEGRALRTFASRAVFSPTYTPPEKMIPTFFALASANSARLPCAIAKCRCKKYPAGKTPAGYGIYRYSMAMTLLFGSCFFAAFGREICRMPFSNFARMSSGSTCSPT